ncbi:MAG: helix-turn-helix domain-containing protein [Lachnospiraceae bacterium]
MIEYEPHRSSSAEYYIIQHDVNFSFPYHMHKSFEFICVTDGSIICTVNGKDFVLSKNRAMLILPHEPHSYRTEDHSESSIYIFSPERVPDFYEFISGHYFGSPVFTIDAASTIRLLDNAVQNEFRIKSVLYNICSICVEECKILKKDKSSIVLPELVINYLMENYTKPISLKTMSKSLGYNYNYLSSFFHNNLKTSFCDCLNSYRINLAKTLLLDNSKSITDISAEVGFNTIRTFNRTFVSICGTTPTQYRKDFVKEAYIKEK